MTFQDAYFAKDFELAFLRAKGSEFETFFHRLMKLAYPTDFMPTCPWGSAGDRKNDGFLASDQRLFQVYGPTEMKAHKAIAKIRADFEGAKFHWSAHFTRWTFVHNADRLPPHVQTVILELKAANPGIAIETWGLEQLLLVFRGLSPEDKASWFGPVPDATNLKVGFQELRLVLERIAAKPAVALPDVHDVPMGKLDSNALSDSVKELLKVGMTKAPLVGEFFASWHDETYGERIAEAFRVRYKSLRQDCTPVEVFGELQTWAAGDRALPDQLVAALAVIAYFFDSCDIFEAPRSSVESGVS